MSLRLRRSLILGLASLLFVACASAPEPRFARAPAAWTASESEVDRLRDAVTANRAKVAEFAFLKRWAAERGYRVWIAGGSAAGFAHYVKADLERARRPGRYLDSRFGYKYFQIFRSTQDADVVIDTGEEEAAALEKALKENFDYLQGSKSAWEVRLLRQPRGSGAGLKEPLIDNPNFRNQNSDSHSTGMIELTDPPRGESVVRDLFAWDEHRAPPFLADVAEGKLHFYANALHATTSRARAGLNPEILSVIRYFTKAFQYGLDIREEDVPAIRRIIDGFDPNDPALKPARGQIENNAKKLYAHAEDLERAYRTLERFGLRKKLLAFGGKPAAGKMSGLLDRVPLLSLAFGTEGRKASEIFGLGRTIVVSHETNDLLAYESITRSRRGLPNVLISRKGGAGETAIHGDGFYTKVGREGARNTGLTIRFALHPEAREGHDFTYVETDDYVVVRNRSALRVIDESVEMKPLDFFRFVSEAELTPSDLGLWKMMGMVIQSDLSALAPAEREAILDLAVASMEKEASPIWIRQFLFPNLSLKSDLRNRLLALPPEKRGAIGLQFWSLSIPGTPEDPVQSAAYRPWREFLAESDAFVASRSEIGPTLERILAGAAGNSAFPPLLPKPCNGLDAALKHLLRYAEIAEGLEAVKRRIVALGSERKAEFLSLAHEFAFEQNNIRRETVDYDFYAVARDSFISDPNRTADFPTRWRLDKIAVGLYETRLRIGPVTESEIRGLVDKDFRGLGRLTGLRKALEGALAGTDPQAAASAARIALAFAQGGRSNLVLRRSEFIQILGRHPARLRGTPVFASARTLVPDFVDEILSRYPRRGAPVPIGSEASFLVDAFASPDFFDETSWLKLLQKAREEPHWKRILGGILVAAYGVNPYFHDRPDLFELCFNKSSFDVETWGLPIEVQGRGYAGLAKEYRAQIAEKVRAGELRGGAIYAAWKAQCPALLAK